MRDTHTKEGFNIFKRGHTLVDSYQRFGRPRNPRNAAVIEKVENLIMKDLRFTARETAEQVEICTGSPRAILCNKRKVAAKFVPELLSGKQKNSVFQLHRT
ncbi:hypothetical protein TNCV_3773901 [Trichonephila clavipes]|nr:hypothetical protein TNCV_3773901 [Trichonephila clavipes]